MHCPTYRNHRLIQDKLYGAAEGVIVSEGSIEVVGCCVSRPVQDDILVGHRTCSRTITLQGWLYLEDERICWCDDSVLRVAINFDIDGFFDLECTDCLSDFVASHDESVGTFIANGEVGQWGEDSSCANRRVHVEEVTVWTGRSVATLCVCEPDKAIWVRAFELVGSDLADFSTGELDFFEGEF